MMRWRYSLWGRIAAVVVVLLVATLYLLRH
jgi:hypothetical protein